MHFSSDSENYSSLVRSGTDKERSHRSMCITEPIRCFWKWGLALWPKWSEREQKKTIRDPSRVLRNSLKTICTIRKKFVSFQRRCIFARHRYIRSDGNVSALRPQTSTQHAQAHARWTPTATTMGASPTTTTKNQERKIEGLMRFHGFPIGFP